MTVLMIMMLMMVVIVMIMQAKRRSSGQRGAEVALSRSVSERIEEARECILPEVRGSRGCSRCSVLDR